MSDAFVVTRENILKRASQIVTGDREQTYGSPENNFSTIARMWSEYLNRACGLTDLALSADDVAAMMILMKVSRIASGQAKTDNWVDIAGYAACGGELEALASCLPE